MKATVTRTIQVSQYNPETLTLEEECTPESYTSTLNRLRKCIEDNFIARYPYLKDVIPSYPKSTHEPVTVTITRGDRLPSEPVIIQRPKGKSLLTQIENCKTEKELKVLEIFLDSDAADISYKEKMIELKNK